MPEHALLVSDLADPTRRAHAFALLLQAGQTATDDVVAGLSHPYWQVRRWCCRFLDHYSNAAAQEQLVVALRDPHRKVRAQALHALGCGHCKEDECAPGGIDPLGYTIDHLTDDRSARVRRLAATGLLQHVLLDAGVDARSLPALRAASRDADPVVRERVRDALDALDTRT